MNKEQKMERKCIPYFPLFVDISGKKVYVVGAGTIANRRIRTLSDFTEHLYVIAPEVNPELINMENDGLLTILRKKYEDGDLADADMVIAATNDHKTNEEIYVYCREKGILVNVCSDKDMCDFYFPGLIMKDNIVVGVTANGTNHKAARKAADEIREMFEKWK